MKFFLGSLLSTRVNIVHSFVKKNNSKFHPIWLVSTRVTRSLKFFSYAKSIINALGKYAKNSYQPIVNNKF